MANAVSFAKYKEHLKFKYLENEECKLSEKIKHITSCYFSSYIKDASVYMSA